MVRCHYDDFLAGHPGFDELKAKTFELCEFLSDVAGAKEMPGRFPHRVGLHQSCHGLRELRLGSSSERVEPASAKCGNCSRRRGIRIGHACSGPTNAAVSAARLPSPRKPFRA